MRTIQRGVRRSGIPVSYSKGFNPHSEFSFATPLSVGIWSTGEYMEMKLDFEMDTEEILNKVNESLPGEIKFLHIAMIDEKFPAIMSIIEAASYEIDMVNISQNMFDKGTLNEFMKAEKIEVVKSGKKGERVVDIKPMIFDINLQKQYEKGAIISATIASGSKNNLNPQLIVDAIMKYIKGMEEIEIRDIKKVETYVKRDGRLMTPFELLERDYI